MRKLFIIVFLISFNTFAEDSDIIIHEEFTPLKIGQMFDSKNSISLSSVPNLILKEKKLNTCIVQYKKRQRAYAKVVQTNLYDLIHNFGKVISKIHGKNQKDDVPHEIKIEKLAEMQCETYYNLGILK